MGAPVKPRFGELATVLVEAGICFNHLAPRSHRGKGEFYTYDCRHAGKPIPPHDGWVRIIALATPRAWPRSIECLGTMTEAQVFAAIDKAGRSDHIVYAGRDHHSRLILDWTD